MGGLAICEDCDRNTRAQILISLAGPCAGFAFALLVIVLLRIMGQGLALEVANHVIYQGGNVEGARGISLLGVGLYWQELVNPHAQRIIGNLLFINILWGLVNLLPVYPLDGGQVSRELCQIGNPRGGIILSLQISMVAAIVMAAVGLLMWQSIFTTFMFGYLAYSSYQTLIAYRQSMW
jgi:Zn-dependent protease